MTDTTAEQRLDRAVALLDRAENDAANGWGSTADVRRATEDRDAALRAYEREQYNA